VVFEADNNFSLCGLPYHIESTLMVQAAICKALPLSVLPELYLLLPGENGKALYP
jgi:hypothetical protein